MSALPRHYQMCSNWGHRISWTRPEQFEKDHDKETRFDVNGHQSRIPEIGDLLAADFRKSTRLFVFVSVERCGDPCDMFFAQVKCIEVRDKTRGGSLVP